MNIKNGPHSVGGRVPNSNASNQDMDSETFDPVRAETALWRAVITQALMDAGSESRKPEAAQEKRQAIRWLLGNSEDFITVCLNADLDPSHIRSKALAAIERGCVWRQGMAEKRLQGQDASLPKGYEKKSLHRRPIAPYPHTSFRSNSLQSIGRSAQKPSSTLPATLPRFACGVTLQ